MENGQSGLEQCQSCVNVVAESGNFAAAEWVQLGGVVATLFGVFVALWLGVSSMRRDRLQDDELLRFRREDQVKRVTLWGMRDWWDSPDLPFWTIHVNNDSEYPISNVTVYCRADLEGNSTEEDVPHGLGVIPPGEKRKVEIGLEAWDNSEQNARVIFFDANGVCWSKDTSGRFLEILDN